MYFIVNIMYYFNHIGKNINRAIDLLYLITSRLLFCFFLYLFTLPSLVGVQNLITKFLCNDIFCVLSKLSYSMFQLDNMLILYFSFNIYNSPRFDITYIYINSFNFLIWALII